MSKKVEFNIPELNSMKKYPEELNYIGNLELLKNKKSLLLEVVLQINMQEI